MSYDFRNQIDLLQVFIHYTTRCVATSPMGSTMEYSAAMAVRASSKDRFAGASSTPVYVSPSPRISLALGQFQSEMKNKKIPNFTLQAEQHTLNNSIHLL